MKLFLTSQPDKRFKKYLVSLLNISRRISVRRGNMGEGNQALTSLCCDCTSKFSYPTTKLKKLYIYYSVLLCSLSKLYYIIRMYNTLNSKLNGELTNFYRLYNRINNFKDNIYDFKGNFSSLRDNFYNLRDNCYSFVNGFYKLQNYFYSP